MKIVEESTTKIVYEKTIKPQPSPLYVVTAETICDGCDMCNEYGRADCEIMVRMRRYPLVPVSDRRSTNQFLASLDSLNCDEKCTYFHSSICDDKAICQMAHDIVAEHDAAIRKELNVAIHNDKESHARYDGFTWIRLIDIDLVAESLRRGGK